jgi:NAD(P)-dependent dehydrogenase (short-subunit alcohol dehydrogenase family)
LSPGASSGIGKATALALKKAGYTVYGTSRSPEKAGGEAAGVRFLPMELTDTDSIDRLVSSLPALDVLVCCAASSLMSAVETTPIDKIRSISSSSCSAISGSYRVCCPVCGRPAAA